MSFTAFLLKLVGKHPEQVEEQERFDSNMENLDKHRGKLDSLLEDIKDVRKTVREKSDAFETVTSLRPEGNERQEEESGDISVSVEELIPS